MTLAEDVEMAIATLCAKGYQPVRLRAMIGQHGYAEACKRLVVNGELQSGYFAVRKLHCEHLSIEAIVMRHPEEFPPPVIACAHWRRKVAANKRHGL